MRSLFASFRFNSPVYTMGSIPNFTSADIETVGQLVHQRYGETIKNQITDSELTLNPKREQRVNCPTLFWYVHGANFPVIRSGLNRFHCQFFIPHTTSMAVAEKNMSRSNSASPPYCRYRQIMNETMAYLNSNANLAADQFSIDTGVGN